MPLSRYAALTAALTIVLGLPLALLLLSSGSVLDGIDALLSTLGLALIASAVLALARGRARAAATAMVIAVLGCGWLVRFGYGFLYDFTGRGFGSEMFLHAGPTSLSIALDEYGIEFGVVTALLVAIVVGLVRWTRGLPPAARRGPAAVGMASGVALFAVGAGAAPEYLLARAAYRYYAPVEASADGNVGSRQAAAETLAVIRGAAPLPVHRSELVARVDGSGYNLVLIYLESFNLSLSENSDYPGLTPKIDRLKRRLHSFEQVQSSAYLTIEGIANSQCGTVIDMEHANNSMLSESGRMPGLPCLGDVLREAGYRQVYLGGADLGFAGKGSFLRDHGYDEVFGWRYWNSVGLKRSGKWGIADGDLFAEADRTLERLRSGGRPFNLTLLTLGMHPPGYAYPDCPRFTEDEARDFLNAVHCTDHLLGRFVDRLAERGALDDTVLFIQADHGVFENPEMRELFGDGVEDRRLLTLVGVPDGHPRADALVGATGRRAASVDTAATLLDLLGITGNAGFVFSRSLLGERDDPGYYVTRRVDHWRGSVQVNTPASCAGDEGDGPLSLPLNRCGKRRVLDALRMLHAGYTAEAEDDAGACRLGATVDLDRAREVFRVRWGDRDLSNQFHHRGTRVRGGKYRGIYAVHLDRREGAPRAYFYGSDNDYDLWQLRRLLDSVAEGEHVLLIADLDPAQMTAGQRAILPPELDGRALFYGTRRADGLVSSLTEGRLPVRINFRPSSCPGGAGRL